MGDVETLERIIRTRRSVRRFTGEPIPRVDLARIMEAAVYAPSAANQQPWHFAAVVGRRRIREMAASVRAALDAIAQGIKSASAAEKFAAYTPYLTFFEDAGAVICVFAENYRGMLERLLDRYAPAAREGWEVSAAEQSVAAAIQNTLLMVHALGYGGCWMTGPLIAKEEIQRGIAPPGDWRLVALVAIGRPATGASADTPPRRRREETVAFYDDAD